MRGLRILLAVFGAILALQLTGAWVVTRFDRNHNRVDNRGPLPEITEAAASLHDTLFVADLHADSLLWRRDLGTRNATGHIDVPRLREGGVGLQVFGAVTSVPRDPNYRSNRADSDNITLLAVASGWSVRSWFDLYERAMYLTSRLEKLARESNGELRIIRTRADLQWLIAARSRGEQRIGAMLALEGAHALGGNADNLRRLFDVGYRMLGLAHFFDNDATGSASGANKSGLTEFGHRIIELATALGMVIDASHASRAAVTELLESASAPVVFSHSGVTATCSQHGRNLDDAQLRQLARNGGIVGVGLWRGAICGASLDHFLDAVDHAVRVAGIDHVGLGSDFDAGVSTPIDSSQWAHVTAGLLARGYGSEEIRRIMGNNAVRVLMRTLPED